MVAFFGGGKHGAVILGASEDANFYIILSLRNFNRGPPMLPADSQDSVSMSILGGEPWCSLSGLKGCVW